MSVRPVDMLMMQQINEVSHIRQEETARTAQQQTNIVNNNQKDTEVKSEQVNQKDNVDNQNKKFDAREKSDNEYQGNGGSNNRNEKREDGTVKIKSLNHGGFDIKI